MALPSQTVPGNVICTICLCNRENGEVFIWISAIVEDETIIADELLNFAKTEAELKTDIDWWHFIRS